MEWEPTPAVEGRPTPNGSDPMVPPALELLLDVELPVSISFGSTQLPLRDVLKITTGSVIELNRSVDDLVEVIVNNCVIARGEVVVMEGNYGVKIRDVVSRKDRLALQRLSRSSGPTARAPF